MRSLLLVVLLSLLSVNAFVQAAGATATTATQAADTTAAPAAQPSDSTAAPAKQPAATTPPPAAAPAAATTTPPPAAAPAETATETDSGGGRKWKFGAGVHYMKTVGDVKDAEGFDSNAMNVLVAAKMGLGRITIEGDSEWSFNYGGTDKTLWIPQAFAFLGKRMFYGGAGIGAGRLDGNWFDNPVYSLRAGAELSVGRFGVDVNASYQFMSSKAIENASTDDLDSVTFGGILWF
jgi:hypothetical protein